MLVGSFRLKFILGLILAVGLLPFRGYAQNQTATDEIILIKPEVSGPQESQEAELKLKFAVDEKLIAEKRDKLAVLGKDTLYAVIFKDLKRYYAEPISLTTLEYPLGPRIDLMALRPDLAGKSDIERKKLELKKYFTETTLNSLLSDFQTLNADQLADFIVRKEIWLKTVANSFFDLQEKLQLGSRENPKTIQRANQLIRFMNNAFYTAPLNVAYSNTFGVQLGLSGYLGLSAGTWTEEFLRKRIRFSFNLEIIKETRRIVEETALVAQKLIEERLHKEHSKPWIKLRQGDYGLYLSLTLGSAVSFRTVNGATQINWELFTDMDTYKTAKSPVVQAYADANAGAFLEQRTTGRERLFTYVRTFMPFVSIFAKGENHMAVVGGVPIIPNIPALLETKASRYYFFRLPLNQEAKAARGPNPMISVIKKLKDSAVENMSCSRFFK